MFFGNPAAYWAATVEAGMVVIEAQAVIAMRIMGSAGVWSVTPMEDSRMVSEKIEALSRAATAATRVAISGGTPDKIAQAALKPIRQKTRANVKRLGKRGMKRG